MTPLDCMDISVKADVRDAGLTPESGVGGVDGPAALSDPRDAGCDGVAAPFGEEGDFKVEDRFFGSGALILGLSFGGIPSRSA